MGVGCDQVVLQALKINVITHLHKVYIVILPMLTICKYLQKTAIRRQLTNYCLISLQRHKQKIVKMEYLITI